MYDPRHIQRILAFRPHIARMETLRILPADASGATAIAHRLIGDGIPLANIAPVNGPGTRLNPTLVSINRSLK
jgi:hypothetical protein